MATPQELLQAQSQLQQNAQAGLPIIPNNGNPNGANNMPFANTHKRPIRSPNAVPEPPLMSGAQRPPEYYYPWMAPSPSTDVIQQILAQPIQGGKYQPPQTPLPNMPATPIYDTGPGQLPILPQGDGTMPGYNPMGTQYQMTQGPTLPSNAKGVMPNNAGYANDNLYGGDPGQAYPVMPQLARMQ